MSELRRKATTRFEEGAAAYREQRYEDAARAFLAADQLLPSPVLSFNVGRAYEKLGDTARALAFYQDYLRRDPAPAHAEPIRDRIAAFTNTLLSSGGSLLTVLSEPGAAAVIIDGRALGSTPWAGTLTSGKHRVTLTKPGSQNESRDVELASGQALELTLALVPGAASNAPPTSAADAPPSAAPVAAKPLHASIERSNRPVFAPWSFVALGAGGAALALAGIFELARHSAEKDARDAPTQIAYADRYDAMRGRQTTARVFAVSGGALLLAGGALLALDITRRSDSAPTAALAWDGRSCVGTFAASF